MKIKNIEDGKYDLNGNLYFNDDSIKINVKDALKIAYTLFDWAGMSYTQLDEINEKVEG